MKALKLFQHYSILIRPQRVLWEMGRISPLNILKALSKWSSKHYCRHGDWATKGDCCLAQVTHTDSWQSRTRTPILLCLHYPPYIPFHIYRPPPPAGAKDTPLLHNCTPRQPQRLHSPGEPAQVLSIPCFIADGAQPHQELKQKNP